MKKVLVIVMLIFAFGCSDDATEPSENTIVGKWKSELFILALEDGTLVNTYRVLEFNNNGTYSFYHEDEELDLLNDSGTYTISNNELTILNNECLGIEGKYEVLFDDNGFEIKLKEDDCERNHILSDFYYNFDAEIEK